MRVMPISFSSSNIYTNVRKRKLSESPIEKENLSSVSFKSSVGNALKIIGGTAVGLGLGALTGGFGAALFGALIGTTGGAFTCDSDKKDNDGSSNSDNSDLYYPYP